MQYQNYYEVLDIKMNSNSQDIHQAYMRAKNTYGKDSMLSVGLFDREQTKQILEEIELAYSILSDPHKRQQYDLSHGFITIETKSASEEQAQLLNNLKAGLSSVDKMDLEEKEEVRPSQQTPLEELLSPKVDASEQNNSSVTEPGPTNSFAYNKHLVLKSFEEKPELEEKFAQAENVSGEFLREAREYKKVTIDEMMKYTKLSRRYVEAIESDQKNKLPAAVFVRGFVTQYAKALLLDEKKITQSYMKHFQSL